MAEHQSEKGKLTQEQSIFSFSHEPVDAVHNFFTWSTAAGLMTENKMKVIFYLFVKEVGTCLLQNSKKGIEK